MTVDRLNALRLLLRVADSGSFSAAAKAVGVTQPVVSRVIAGLEAELGARLFHRTTRSLSLTDAGRRAYSHAVVLVEENDALEAAVRGADRAPVGLLRVSASVAFTRAELLPSTPGLLAAYPDLKVDFAADEQRVDLAGQAVDLAFRLGDLEDSDLTAMRLGAYARILVASPELAAQIEAAPGPETLDRWPLVQFTAAPYGSRWPLGAGERRLVVQASGAVRASSGEVVLHAALGGLGVALLPTFAVRDALRDGALIQVLPAWRGPPLALHAVWAGGRTPPRKVRAFLDLIRPALRFV